MKFKMRDVVYERLEGWNRLSSYIKHINRFPCEYSLAQGNKQPKEIIKNCKK